MSQATTHELPSDVWGTDVYGKPCPRKDPHEFVREYATKSGVPVRELFATDLRVAYCTCGEEGCCGWQMQTQAWVDEQQRLGLLADFTKVYAPKEVYRGETPEEYYEIHYPDMDPEELKLALAMDASYPVATFTCVCGRIHEVEFTPPEHGGQGFVGNYCACGHKVHFEDSSA
jgi:hypothetical protein